MQLYKIFYKRSIRNITCRAYVIANSEQYAKSLLFARLSIGYAARRYPDATTEIVKIEVIPMEPKVFF